MDLNTLDEKIKNVRLHIHQPGGPVQHVGHSGPQIDWHLHHRHSLRSILKRPELNLGSSYVRGEWDVDTRQLGALMQALVSRQARPRFAPLRLWQRLRAQLPHNRRRQRQPHWQDTSVWLSRLCLGDDLFQTCALYSEPGMSMEQAQRTRANSLVERLQLRAGQHLLDLNAGWGSLALHLAQQAQVQVTAMVKTREQLRVAQRAAQRRCLDGLVHFRLGNLHQCRGHFDRILASGYFEYFSETSYPVLLRRLGELLHDDGFVWLQVTGRSSNTDLSNRWYQAQLPSPDSLPLLADIEHALEATRLHTLLVEDQSPQRLRDLEHQALRFHRHRGTISRRFGEYLARHWEFQLASQTMALRWRQLSQYELLLGNTRSVGPVMTAAGQEPLEDLPQDVASRIPGLARRRPVR
ncbi:MAG TPA: methyltransferase domain-containing protein [Gammaproteobacteria bacterium]|nr:methyltransferase domain-containing protein [Gammaproteobacteria bacterium]